LSLQRFRLPEAILTKRFVEATKPFSPWDKTAS